MGRRPGSESGKGDMTLPEKRQDHIGEAEGPPPPQSETKPILSTPPVKPLFRFLTAQQILDLTELTARQALPVEPEPRDVFAFGTHPHQDTALAYVFISHRWANPGHPDTEGTQLATLQVFFRRVQELLVACDEGLSWPEDLRALVHGQPAAASLVSRLSWEGAVTEVRRRPLDHIYVWYDAACLPQQFPRGRTEEETREFAMALQHLDQLARVCEVVCVYEAIGREDEYLHRAWCAFEHYQKNLEQYQGHIHLYCREVLAQTQVDWGVPKEEPPAAEESDSIEKNSHSSKERKEGGNAPSPTLEQGVEAVLATTKQGDVEGVQQFMKQFVQSRQKKSSGVIDEVSRVVANSRRVELKTNQVRWNGLHQHIRNALKKNPRKPKKPSPSSQNPPKLNKTERLPNAKPVASHLPQSLSTRKRSASLGSLSPGFYPSKSIPATAESLQAPTKAPSPTNSTITAKPMTAPPFRPSPVPDLIRGWVRIQNCGLTAPPAPPFLDAMNYLIRELYTAVFYMSCRDAAAFWNKASSNDAIPVVVPANSNECVPGVGIRCGLHDHHQARPVEEQAKALQMCIETSWKTLRMSPQTCLSGHTLQPGISPSPLKCDDPSCSQKAIAAGDVHAGCPSCDYDICYRCATGKGGDSKVVPYTQACLDEVIRACSLVPRAAPSPTSETPPTLCERSITIDLYGLVNSIFTRLGLRCTNGRDVAFVGLLALRNILSLNQNDADGKINNKNGLYVSAGCLCLLAPVLDEAVLLYANLLAADLPVSSLNATIYIKVPRWVLLDNANKKLSVNSILTMKGTFSLGRKAQEYLTQHRGCISFSFDTNEAPLRRVLCQDASNCHSGWAPCQHEMQKSVFASISNATQAPGTLDPWITISLPSKLALFATLCANKKIYVIGGANGDQDPNTKLYTTCLPKVYTTDLPLNASTTWSSGPSLNCARRNHCACVQTDTGGDPVALLVGGGKESSVVGQEGALISSVEALRLDGDDSQWETVLELPRPRTSGHMVFVKDCLFVFGGRSHPEYHSPASQRCDIYDYRTQEWKEGPEHPVSFSGGGLAVVEDRFACIFGGVIDSKFLEESWILDLKPWVQWIETGCLNDERPSTPVQNWIKWIPLPTPMGSPNICVASKKDTGLGNVWILSVAPTDCGNFCFGMKIPLIIEWFQQAELLPNEQGFRKSSIIYHTRWSRLGATPDAFAMGGQVVTHGTVAMLGGLGAINDGVGPHVHVRQLPTKGNIMPLGVADPGRAAGGKGMMAILREFGQNFTANQAIQLNDTYLIGRLGFPLDESVLFAPSNGVKMFSVRVPEQKCCQKCLADTHSILTAQAHNDTALYGLRAPAKAPRGPRNPGFAPRLVPLCSECLCDLYYNQPLS